MKLSSLPTTLLRGFHLVFFLLFAWTFCNVLLTTTWLWPVTLLVCAIVFTCFFILLQMLPGEGLSEKHLRMVSAAIVAAGLLIQLLVCRRLLVYPDSWDFGAVYRNALAIGESGIWEVPQVEYFIRYPNNQMLLVVLSLYYRVLTVLGIGRYAAASIALNLALVNTAIVLIYLFCKKLWGASTALFSLLLCYTCFPLYLYLPIFYTDTFAMPFVAGVAYCYLCAVKSSGKKRLVYYALCGFLGFWGYGLKAFTAVVVVALLIHSAFSGPWRQTVSCLLAVALAFAGGYALFHIPLARSGLFPKELREQYEFPYTHWIMMGLTGSGGFKQEDVEYTWSFPTAAEKKEANREVIRQRLEDMGPGGFVRLLQRKHRYTWGNGDYNARHYLQHSPVWENSIHETVLARGENHRYFEMVYNGYHEAMLLCILLSLWAGFRRPKADLSFFLRLSLFGLYFLLSLWETNARYLLHFSPVIVLTSIDGVRQAVYSREKKQG